MKLTSVNSCDANKWTSGCTDGLAASAGCCSGGPTLQLHHQPAASPRITQHKKHHFLLLCYFVISLYINMELLPTYRFKSEMSMAFGKTSWTHLPQQHNILALLVLADELLDIPIVYSINTFMSKYWVSLFLNINKILLKCLKICSSFWIVAGFIFHFFWLLCGKMFL